MSVPEESDGHGICDERRDGIADANHVFIFVERRAVYELEVRQFVEVNRALGKGAKPCEIFGGELFARPEGGEPCGGIELFEVHEAADCLVVIASHKDASNRLSAGDDFVRIPPIANRIAEIDDQIMSGSRSQTGVQRFEIAMNVAEKKYTHGKVRIIAFLGRKARGGLFSVPGSRFSVGLDLTGLTTDN